MRLKQGVAKINFSLGVKEVNLSSFSELRVYVKENRRTRQVGVIETATKDRIEDIMK